MQVPWEGSALMIFFFGGGGGSDHCIVAILLNKMILMKPLRSSKTKPDLNLCFCGASI